MSDEYVRSLAHVEKVIDINPIAGADRVELATVLGWHCMVQKNQFHVGDLAVYIEIDSKCPPTEAFKFLEPKHYAVKTQKYFKGTVISQGLLMHPDDLGLNADELTEGQDLTEKIGVTYYEQEDNKRKAPSVDKYKKMAQRNQKLFSKKPIRWLMRRDWGKKLLFLFFGRKKDRSGGWPEWVVKTDEIRCQNAPWVFEEKTPRIVTEKIDGTSATYTLKRGKRGGNDFYVCSRNVVQDNENHETYYKTNVYWEIAEKYEIEQVLIFLLNYKFPDAEWITIQGEIYGKGIQKREYSLDHHEFAAFNLITSDRGRFGTLEMERILKQYSIPCVPIVNASFILPDTVDEMLEYATDKSKIDGLEREGVVCRKPDGTGSFKAVSNEYLMKYHS